MREQGNTAQPQRQTRQSMHTDFGVCEWIFVYIFIPQLLCICRNITAILLINLSFNPSGNGCIPYCN